MGVSATSANHFDSTRGKASRPGSAPPFQRRPKASQSPGPIPDKFTSPDSARLACCLVCRATYQTRSRPADAGDNCSSGKTAALQDGNAVLLRELSGLGKIYPE